MTPNTELSDEQIFEIANQHLDGNGHGLIWENDPDYAAYANLPKSARWTQTVRAEQTLTFARAILSAVSRSEVGEPAPVGEPVAQAEYVIRLLVAAGHVTQQKVDEAFAIAKEYASHCTLEQNGEPRCKKQCGICTDGVPEGS